MKGVVQVETSQSRVQAPKLLPALTGLRGLAALWVVLFHVAPNVSHVLGGTIETLPIIRDGYLGVDVFFILSGFILSHVYQNAFLRFTWKEHAHFLLLRLARIYPLHAFALSVLVIIVVLLPGFAGHYDPGFFSLKHLFFSALLLQNWLPNPIVWNGPAWSLSAEWVAYMVFPLVLLSCRKVKLPLVALLLAGLLLGFLSAVFLITGRSLDAPGMKAGFLRLACEFSAGSLLQRAYMLNGGRALGGFAITALTCVAAVAALSRPSLIPLVLLPFGYLILLLAQPGRALAELFSHSFAVFLGEISYSVYLMHWMLIQVEEYAVRRAAPSGFGRVAALLALLSGLACIAVFTWKYVEKPARHLGRKVATRLALS